MCTLIVDSIELISNLDIQNYFASFHCNVVYNQGRFFPHLTLFRLPGSSYAEKGGIANIVPFTINVS